MREEVCTLYQSCRAQIVMIQLGHLIAHYRLVGGDKDVIKDAELLQGSLLAPVQCFERALSVSPTGACRITYEICD